MGRKYDVSKSSIRDWCKNKTQLQEMNSNCQAFRGQKVKHLELEKRLCDYVDKVNMGAQLLVKCAS